MLKVKETTTMCSLCRWNRCDCWIVLATNPHRARCTSQPHISSLWRATPIIHQLVHKRSGWVLKDGTMPHKVATYCLCPCEIAWNCIKWLAGFSCIAQQSLSFGNRSVVDRQEEVDTFNSRLMIVTRRVTEQWRGEPKDDLNMGTWSVYVKCTGGV